MIPRLIGSFSQWLVTAEPGSRVIVQTAPHNSNSEVTEALDAGLIIVCQKRAEGHAFHLIATKRTKPAKAETAPIGAGMVRSHLGLTKGEKHERMRKAAELRSRGLTLREIEEALRMSDKTVKRYLAQARKEGLLEAVNG